jgi:site-specific DNA recombinase
MKAALYLRQSDPSKKALDGFDKTLSLESQETQCREFASKQGWQVVAVYSEQITSEIFEGRPELKRMMDATGFEIILCWKYDRVARDPMQAIVFTRLMAARNIEVYSVLEGKTQNNEMGELVTFIMGTVGKMQKKSILQNSLATKKKLQQEGLLICSGKARYGYSYNKKLRQREINEAEADTVRRIFSLAADGWSLRQIAILLNKEGIKAPFNFWKPVTIHRMIKDPTYYGVAFQSHKKEQVDRREPSGRRGHRLLDSSEWVSVGESSPEIVSQSLWERANTCLSNSAKRPAKMSLDLWLRGHVFCSICGHSMTCYTSRGKRSYRCFHSARADVQGNQCSNKVYVPIGYVEEHVWALILKAITNTEWLSEKIAQALEETHRPDYEIQKKTSVKKLESLRKEIDKLVVARATEIRKVVLASLDRTLDAKAEETEKEEGILGEIEGILADSRSQADLIKEVQNKVSGYVGKEYSFEDKVKIVHALGVRVEIGHTEGLAFLAKEIESFPSTEGLSSVSRSEQIITRLILGGVVTLIPPSSGA